MPSKQGSRPFNLVTDERDSGEDDVLDDKEVVMNQRVKQQNPSQKEIDGTYAKFKTTEDMRLEIEKMSYQLEEQEKAKEQQESASATDSALANAQAMERGLLDSDEDDEKRVRNMREPDKRRFNVNDVLGEFDRDERGHPMILQDKKGELIDKDGNRVNEKGYLVDPKTGDVLEKEQGRKVFRAEELDERGELPPPYNLERYNFNGHDVRGYFDRDA